jgi:outer membrane biosynthesis protein TonB
VGNVREPYIRISGGADYDKQALKSVRHWKFAPGMLDGQSIIVRTVIVTDFRVKQ